MSEKLVEEYLSEIVDELHNHNQNLQELITEVRILNEKFQPAEKKQVQTTKPKLTIDAVKQRLNEFGPKFIFEDLPDKIIVKPKYYLKTEFKAVAQKIEETFGSKWTSDGKNSRWEIMK